MYGELQEVQRHGRNRETVINHSYIDSGESHPNSMPPSINDFNSAFKNEYKMCIVCCHDGKIYIYNSKKHIVEFFYKSTISKYRKKGFDDFESQTNALLEFQSNGDIFMKEV